MTQTPHSDTHLAYTEGQSYYPTILQVMKTRRLAQVKLERTQNHLSVFYAELEHRGREQGR